MGKGNSIEMVLSKTKFKNIKYYIYKKVKIPHELLSSIEEIKIGKSSGNAHRGDDLIKKEDKILFRKKV
jgi:hypothetical protein